MNIPCEVLRKRRRVAATHANFVQVAQHVKNHELAVWSNIQARPRRFTGFNCNFIKGVRWVIHVPLFNVRFCFFFTVVLGECGRYYTKLFFVFIIIVFPSACYLFSVYIRVHELA